jgi:hypothetical protein
VWVEFADVQAINKQIGANPTTQYPDGAPRYTLPTIHDLNTGRIVSESYAIARYLDEQYTDRPVLTKATEADQGDFAKNADSVVGPVDCRFFLACSLGLQYSGWARLMLAKLMG